MSIFKTRGRGETIIAKSIMWQSKVQSSKPNGLTYRELSLRQTSNWIHSLTYPMVLTVHINKWDITRVLVNNDSQDKILFL
jgi:hypothetical protein